MSKLFDCLESIHRFFCDSELGRHCKIACQGLHKKQNVWKLQLSFNGIWTQLVLERSNENSTHLMSSSTYIQAWPYLVNSNLMKLEVVIRKVYAVGNTGLISRENCQRQLNSCLMMFTGERGQVVHSSLAFHQKLQNLLVVFCEVVSKARLLFHFLLSFNEEMCLVPLPRVGYTSFHRKNPESQYTLCKILLKKMATF